MEKRLLIVLVLLSLLVALVGVAAAPMAGGTATLLGVGFTHGRVVFTFKVTGDYSAEDLEGLMVVDGQSYNLNCRKVNFEIVKCTAPKKAENHTVNLYWGGTAYTAEVHDASGPEYCYGVWDYWDFTDNAWTNFGPQCQEAPAQVGDELWYTVPDPTGSFEAPVWFENSPACDTTPNHGPAYYWDDC